MDETPDTDTLTEPPTDRPDQGPTGPTRHGALERASALTRSHDDRYLGGIAGGLARHLDVDPLLVRVVLVVLGLFGIGVVLYVALWVLLPDDVRGSAAVTTSPATRGWLVLGIAGVAALFLLGPVLGFGNDGSLLVFLALVAGVVLFVRERRSRRAPRPAGPRPADTGQGQAVAWTSPPAPARRRRTGPLLLWPALALVAVVWGALGLLEALGVSVRGSLYPAAGLTIVGVLLVVGAWRGRPLLLGLLGLAMTIALAITSANDAGAFDPDVATVTPTSAEALPRAVDFGTGRYELDLRDLDPGELAGRGIDVRGDLGEIYVLLPRSVPVHLVADVDVVGEVAVREFGDFSVPDAAGRTGAAADLSGCSGFGCGVDVLLTPDGVRDAPTAAELAALPEPPLDLRLDLRAGAVTLGRQR